MQNTNPVVYVYVQWNKSCCKLYVTDETYRNLVEPSIAIQFLRGLSALTLLQELRYGNEIRRKYRTNIVVYRLSRNAARIIKRLRHSEL